MQITIFQGQGKKKERTYDLEEKKDLSQLKSKITRAKNAGENETLKEIKRQLKKLEESDTRKELLETIAAGMQALKQQAAVTVKTDRASYDLNQTKRVKDLEKRIRAFAQGKKTEKLKTLKAGLDQHPQHVAAKELAAEAERLIAALEAPVAYQPYTKLLQAEFFDEPRERSTFDRVSRQRKSALEKYTDPKTLEAYLAKSVTAKKKTGQENFEDLADYALFDLCSNPSFQTQLTTDPSFRLLFITAVLGHFSHNSSHYPAQGQGKATRSEQELPGRYFRSENDHPVVEATRALTQPLKTEAQSKACYGEQNILVVQLMIAQLDQYQETNAHATLTKTQLTALDHSGRLQTGTTGTGTGPLLAHVGARANNVKQYIAALTALGELSEATLSTLLERPTPRATVTNVDITASTSALQRKFAELAQQPLALIDNLPSRMAAARTSQATAIATSCAALTQINVTALDETNCLVLKLYPTFTGDARHSENFEQGLTNVIIGFLGGLINYNANARGLSAWMQRRQSFGFLHSTITDIDSLQIRISLGLESDAFKQVIIDSIKQLNDLLATYNFITPKSSTTAESQQLVAKVLTPCERSRGASTTSGGNYLLNAMRTPDDQWIALLVAQKFLSTAEETNTVEEIFAKYLEKFIVERVEHKKTGEADHHQIKRFGFSIPQTADPVLPEPLASTACETLKQQNVIFSLLQNLIQSTLHYVAQLTNIPSAYTCYYLLKKLLHACQKGMFILSHLHKYELSHLHAKANLCIDNIFEHMTLLRFMIEKEQASDTLITEEKARLAQALNIATERFQVSYYDSGQQAITTSILMMHEQFKTTKSARNIRLHLSATSYYEVDRYCTDMSITKVSLAEASLAFVDIMDLAAFMQGLPKATKLKAVIIDITHNSTRDTLLRLSAVIEELQQKNIWVILSCSSLKHEQAGQDKYQSGRNIIIPAPGTKLKKDYSALSQNAVNPLFASLRSTVASCFNETGPTLFSPPKAAPLAKSSVMHPPRRHLRVS